MLRLMGAVCVFAALSWCGISRAGWYRRRVECLRAWQSAVSEGERLLCDLELPTASFLERLSKQALLAETARVCLHGLEREQPFSTVWTQALAGAELPLRRDELDTLEELGTVLGRYDVPAQRQALHQAGQRLTEQLQQAESERTRLSRMWCTLGVSAGAVAAIVLY